SSDSPGCLGQTRLFPKLLGSPDQRVVSSTSFLAFMRGNVGPNANPAFNENFDPQYALPAVVASVTRVDRGFTDSPSALVTRVFDDFPTVPTNTYSGNGVTVSFGGASQHDRAQRAAPLERNAPGPT